MSSVQDAQIFKERCEDSPGILIFCQGDWWYPTPERVSLLEKENYLVLTAANGRADIPFWLPQARCIGAMFGHESTIIEAKASFPDKIIERFEGVSNKFLRSITQDPPMVFSPRYNAVMPKELKTVDVVSTYAPVALKRGDLLIESLIKANVSAYVFAHTFGGDQEALSRLIRLIQDAEGILEYIYYPFDPYALMMVNKRIIIDIRPIALNNPLVSIYLSRARLFVHTSTTEGFSNSVMEALNNDVPVLICEDIQGPLQTLSLQIPECIYRVKPSVNELSNRINELIKNQQNEGKTKQIFQEKMDPFTINSRMVVAAQKWFQQRGLPWKGHCLGLFGGVQSKLDLSNVTHEQAYRGSQPIYPNLDFTRQYVTFQANLALNHGQTEKATALVNEMHYLCKLDSKTQT